MDGARKRLWLVCNQGSNREIASLLLTRLSLALDSTLPSGFSDWLSVLTPLGFDVGSFIFPDWKCVGGLTTLLAFNGLWPLVLMLAVVLALAAREAVRKGSIKAVALRSLQAAVFISFCVLPSVTRSLFLAFQCESFGFDDPTSETKSYLTASLDIECTGSDAHQPIIALAVGFIVLWPLAMPLLYALLLYRCRRSIQNHQPSPLSRAIRFLWSDYEDGYYWYEMIALTKKLVRKVVDSMVVTVAGAVVNCAATVPPPSVYALHTCSKHSRALPIVDPTIFRAGADQLCALHQLRRQRPTPSALSGVAHCTSRPNVAAADPTLPQAER